MQNNVCAPEFFLGANTPLGFFSLFEHLYYPDDNWFCYILKGGPGSGKSTLMKSVAKKLLKKNIPTEIIRCASDPQSIDAVISPELKKSIADGTSPHILEPKYPGISEKILSFEKYWDSTGLKNSKDTLLKLFKENALMHKKSTHYLRAYGTVHNENIKLIKKALNKKSLDDFCKKLAKKSIKKCYKNSAKEQLRFISSVTPDGYVFFDKTFEKLSQTLFLFEDEYDITGSYIISFIREHALNYGYDTITFPSPFFPLKLTEGLIIPKLQIGFAVKNPKRSQNIFKNLNMKIKKINTKRFIEKEKFTTNKNMVNFNKKMSKIFLNESIHYLDNAKKIHDEIEGIYASATNYPAITKDFQNFEL